MSASSQNGGGKKADGAARARALLLGLVRPPPPRAAVARAQGRARRPVPGLALRDHAAADHREGGRALLSRASSRACRPCGALRRRRSTTCSSSGPGSATTRAPATCMPAPGRWSSGTADNFPDTKTELRALPGIGAYTAAAIAAIAFDTPRQPGRRQYRARDRAAVRRRGGIAGGQAAHPRARRSARRRRAAPAISRRRMMDLGATICTPKKPACVLCPWMRALRGARARRSGDLSAQGARRRPARCAAARRSSRCAPTDHMLVRTRPEKGLLGGMTEVPTTEWTHDFDEATALAARAVSRRRRWRRMPGVVTQSSRIFRWSLSCHAAQAFQQRTRRRTACAGCRVAELARRSAAQRHAQSDRACARPDALQPHTIFRKRGMPRRRRHVTLRQARPFRPRPTNGGDAHDIDAT